MTGQGCLWCEVVSRLLLLHVAGVMQTAPMSKARRLCLPSPEEQSVRCRLSLCLDFLTFPGFRKVKCEEIQKNKLKDLSALG